MSGPALRKADSHSLIHETALREAEELTNIVENFLKEQDIVRALETAYIAVEHWETRTLRHATAEEEGLYKDIVDEFPETKDRVAGLIRDHDLLRLLVKDVKKILKEDGVNHNVVKRLQALILVDELHNQEEENVLPEH